MVGAKKGNFSGMETEGKKADLLRSQKEWPRLANGAKLAEGGSGEAEPLSRIRLWLQPQIWRRQSRVLPPFQ
jgi:hypothetical protein